MECQQLSGDWIWMNMELVSMADPNPCMLRKVAEISALKATLAQTEAEGQENWIQNRLSNKTFNFLGRKIQLTPFSQRKPCRKSSSMVVSTPPARRWGDLTPPRLRAGADSCGAAGNRSGALGGGRARRGDWYAWGFDGFWRLDIYRYNISIWFDISIYYTYVKLKVLPWNIPWNILMRLQLHLP